MKLSPQSSKPKQTASLFDVILKSRVQEDKRKKMIAVGETCVIRQHEEESSFRPAHITANNRKSEASIASVEAGKRSSEGNVSLQTASNDVLLVPASTSVAAHSQKWSAENARVKTREIKRGIWVPNRALSGEELKVIAMRYWNPNAPYVVEQIYCHDSPRKVIQRYSDGSYDISECCREAS